MNNLDDLSLSKGIPSCGDGPMRIDVNGSDLTAAGARSFVGDVAVEAVATSEDDDLEEGVPKDRDAPERSRAGASRSKKSSDDDWKPSAGFLIPGTFDVLLGRGGTYIVMDSTAHVQNEDRYCARLHNLTTNTFWSRQRTTTTPETNTKGTSSTVARPSSSRRRKTDRTES
jgi:hypothetical protein